jgi:hypothetical protein
MSARPLSPRFTKAQLHLCEEVLLNGNALTTIKKKEV